MAEKVC